MPPICFTQKFTLLTLSLTIQPIIHNETERISFLRYTCIYKRWLKYPFVLQPVFGKLAAA